MAKSSLNLVGAKRQKLELDYLRLAYVCQHYQRVGHQARGVLAVTTAAIREQVMTWAQTYKVPVGMVEVIDVKLESEEITQLLHYQNLNRLAMTGTLDKVTSAGHADATFGRQLVENKLLTHVRALPEYAGVLLRPDVKDLEMGICWDLFGEF